MQDKRVIYPTDEGGVAVIVPAAECGLSIEAIAAKDVPAVLVRGPDGSLVSSTPRPYRIVDAANIPTDRTFRSAWEFAE